MKKKSFLMCILLMLARYMAVSEDIRDMQPLDMPANRTFYEKKTVVDKFLSAFDTMPKGWKQFRRAEASWQNKLMPDGKMVSAKFMLNELNHFINNQHKENVNNRLLGGTWEQLGPDTIDGNTGIGRVNCIKIDPDNDSAIWIGTASGGIWHSKNRGKDWSVIPLTDILSIGILDIAIAPSNHNIMYATTGDASGWELFKSFSVGVLKSTDRGETWAICGETLDLADSIYCSRIQVHPENHDIVYVTTSQSIIKTVNGGNTWEPVVTGYHFRDIELKPDNPDVIYATTFKYGGPVQIIVSEDAGQTWYVTKHMDDATRIELAVTPADPKAVYAVAAHSWIEMGCQGLYVSRSNGLNWDRVEYIIDSDSSGKYDLIYRQGFYNLALEISPVDKNIMLAAGVFPYISFDGGKNWRSYTGYHVDFHSFEFSKDGKEIYIGNDGGVNRGITPATPDEDYICEDISNGLNITQYYRIGSHPYSADILVAGAQDNGTHLFEEGKWRRISSGDGMECQFDPKDLSHIYTSMPSGWGVKGDIDDRFTWITTFVVNPATPDTMLLCGTNVWIKYPNADNDSMLVERISDFPKTDVNNDLRAIATSEKDWNYIYTSSTNRLYATKDYGKNWAELYNTPATIVSIKLHPDNPELIWTGHSGHYKGEKVLQFTNGIMKNISYNLPNVSVNTLAYAADANMLFAGMDIGVFCLNPATDTVWQMINYNMPYLCINELEYVHNTGYLFAGTWGRGVWRYDLRNCNMSKPVISQTGEIVWSNCSCVPPDSMITVYNTNKIEGYKYRWNTGDTTDTLRVPVAKAAEYFLIAQSDNGCHAMSDKLKVSCWATDIIDIPEKPAKLLSRNPACAGKGVKYRFNHAPRYDDFVWSNGSKELEAQYYNDGEAVYVYGIYKEGCIDTLLIDTVHILPSPQAPVIVKNGKYLAIEGDTPAYFEWYKDSVYLDFGDIETPHIPVIGTGNYYVMIWDTNYCGAVSEPYVISLPVLEDGKVQAKVTPNPNTGVFAIEIYSHDSLQADFKICNANGEVVLSLPSETISGYYYKEVDISHLASGAYYLYFEPYTIPFTLSK